MVTPSCTRVIGVAVVLGTGCAVDAKYGGVVVVSALSAWEVAGGCGHVGLVGFGGPRRHR